LDWLLLPHAPTRAKQAAIEMSDTMEERFIKTPSEVVEEGNVHLRPRNLGV
jgi:hypothetical protein